MNATALASPLPHPRPASPSNGGCTLAQAAGNPASLLVDVDGFYTHVSSFNTMLRGGVGRIVAVVGGSGVTALMGYIQVSKLSTSFNVGGITFYLLRSLFVDSLALS